MVFFDGRIRGNHKHSYGYSAPTDHRGLFAVWQNGLLAVILLLVLSSCNSTKFLADDEYLLTRNVVKLEDKVPNSSQLEYDLTTLYQQRPNGSFFFIPREWYYLKSRAKGDTSGLRRILGEPPTFYNDSLTLETAQAMDDYLVYKGFYNASVFPEDEVRGKKVKVTYYTNPGDQFAIDSVFYQSEDPAIDSILQLIKGESLLKRGKGVDYQKYEAEKKRIATYLRNHGYADFFENYFDRMEVDTNQVPKRANLYINVNVPYGESEHQVYRVGRVTIYPNYNPGQDLSSRRDTLIGLYRYRYRPGDMRVKPKIIASAIYLQPGQIFSQEDFDKTNIQLSALGTYRFVRIKQEVDSIQSDVLNFAIQLTPNLKLEMGLDFEVSFTNRSSANVGNLLGLSLNPSFRHRNLFGGAELLVTNLSAGVELNPSVGTTRRGNTRFYNTVDLGIQTELYFPKFLDYLSLYYFLYRIPLGKRRHLLSPTFYDLIRENAATKVSLSYNYLDIFDWYRYNLFNVSYGYDFQRSRTTRYRITHIGVDYLIPNTDPPFDLVLSQNPFLARSFGNQIFVSLLLREFDYLRNGRTDRQGRNFYFNFNTELAGAEIWAANALYNEFALEPVQFRPDTSTNFSQFVSFETDFRYYKRYDPSRTFVARLNVGLARPFGFTNAVPYVKQFFAGGPNDIRAYSPRGLGPGGFLDSLTLELDDRFRFYQTGDIKITMNLEYRFPVFSRLKGAFFLDAGNVWTFREDANRPGSQFLWSKRTSSDGSTVFQPFWRQIAIGGGMGFRFDFTYFIFRLDTAVQLRRNYPDTEDGASIREGDYWNDFRGFGIRDVAFQFGFGYPF